MFLSSFKGVLHPNLKISMFHGLSQNYQYLFEKTMHASYSVFSVLSKELKNSIEILVGQAGFKLRIKMVEIMFYSITQELLGLLKS